MSSKVMSYVIKGHVIKGIGVTPLQIQSFYILMGTTSTACLYERSPHLCKFQADFALCTSRPAIWTSSREVALSSAPPAPRCASVSVGETVVISSSSDFALFVHSY